MRTLYHSTSREAAEAILRDGFLEGDLVLYPKGIQRRGVFLSDIRIPRRAGWVVLAIDTDLSESELDSYERTQRGNDYREWHVPAGRLNGRPMSIV